MRRNKVIAARQNATDLFSRYESHDRETCHSLQLRYILVRLGNGNCGPTILEPLSKIISIDISLPARGSLIHYLVCPCILHGGKCITLGCNVFHLNIALDVATHFRHNVTAGGRRFGDFGAEIALDVDAHSGVILLRVS